MSRLERFEHTFLSFQGRIGRLRYLLNSILPSIVVTVGIVLINLSVEWVSSWIPGGKWMERAFELVRLILVFALFVGGVWIWLSAGVRRLHDLGASGL